MLAMYPKAILHVDGDAFFTSVEQALDPILKGRPVVTGKERGIISCASYEAKARGVRRGIPFFEAKKLCPDLVILSGDYEAYGLFSKRIFEIMRGYTPIVEEYSIDEGFADITGLRRLFRTSYENIARKMQEEIANELGITVSIGLSLSKSLAKLCSDFRKPSGFTAVNGRHIHIILQKVALGDVWGFGQSTVNLLQKYGLKNPYDFVMRPEKWASGLLGKIGRELWSELRGISVYNVETEGQSTHASIMKSKTFTPATEDKAFVYAKLIRNVESAFIKLRRFKLRVKTLSVMLRCSDFRHDGIEVKLNRATSSTVEVVPVVRDLFSSIVRRDTKYRATMILLSGLEKEESEQYELFENRLRIEDMRTLSEAVDLVNGRYGKHTVCSGMALFLRGERGDRDAESERRLRSMPGEDQRRRIGIPRMDVEV